MTLTALFARRSIRRFTSGPVADHQLDTLLRAAMAAPSAGNQQPWQFVVIRRRQLLEAVPGIHPYAAMVPEAALAILVCGDLDGARYPDYWVQDCAAATENLLLAAQDLGLGAVWCGVYPTMERVAAFRRLLDIPPSIIPMALVAIGCPAERKPPADRFRAERVHWDGWDKPR